MADKECRRLHPQPWRHLLVIFMTLVGSVHSQTDSSDLQTPGKKLEDTVFTDMLRIVDHKFDTLTTRITSLERAVSNLQFFSIRQFRQISGSLQSAESDLETVSKKVGQLQVDGRGIKIAMSLLGRDVTELKSTSNDMLRELESSVQYINDHADKQSQYLKTVVEDSFRTNQRATTSLVSRQVEEMSRRIEDQQTELLNCTVDFSNLSDHVDLRFAEFKQQTHAHFVSVINAAKQAGEDREDVEEGESGSSESVDSSEESRNTFEEDDTEKTATIHRRTNIKYNRPQNLAASESQTRRHIPRDGVPFSEHNTNSSDGQANQEYYYETQDENDQRIMTALYNMTKSVLQAVSFFRNTGELMEEIVSNTDVIVHQQADLTRRFDALQLTRQVQSDGPEFEVSNSIPGTEKEGGQRTYSSVISGECVLSNDMANNVATIIKNGSQLLEVLTSLAQMSSVSLSTATAALQDEVKRVEGVRTRMATTMLARTTGDESDPVTKLTNYTQSTFKLLEAVASKTVWLPLIFHNVQHVDALTNRSLHLLTRNHGLLRQIHQTSASKKTQDQGKTVPTFNNRIPRIPASGLSSTLDSASLETIYSTSLQLNRIMPALTKLLAEPDPLITLVEGGRPDQGRVEIYHKGHWGALCHQELSHAEADIICRHLGFTGGISAGAGHFGAGGGITWTFNASCLAASRCPVVEYTEDTAPCSHEQDAAVVCDHMLRIVSSNGSIKEKVGRLEIHHRGMWQPICADAWSGYSARVACQQMGYLDGREMEVGEWVSGSNSTWLSNVRCDGNEMRLDVCKNDGWVDTCPGLAPAGVRCL